MIALQKGTRGGVPRPPGDRLFVCVDVTPVAYSPQPFHVIGILTMKDG